MSVRVRVGEGRRIERGRERGEEKALSAHVSLSTRSFVLFQRFPFSTNVYSHVVVLKIKVGVVRNKLRKYFKVFICNLSVLNVN